MASTAPTTIQPAMATVRHKLPLSLDHLQAAVFHAERAWQIEHGLVPEGRFHPSTHHQASVVASIFASVSFLEAYINEFFSNIADFGVGSAGSITAPQAKVIADLWNRGIPRTARYSILEKYQVALVEAGQVPCDEGRRPFQDVKLLVGLRNALVHFEPEIQESGSAPIDTPRLAQSLAGKIPLSPFVSEFDRVFPQRFLSFGAAAWGVDTAWRLVAEFNTRLNNSFSPDILQELNEINKAAGGASIGARAI